MRSLFVLLTLGLGFTSCRQPDPASPDTLTGVWVEKTARKDTLIFNIDRSGKPLPNTILVNREKEINAGGYLVPKIGSGYYGYELQETTILVVSMLSSSSEKSRYAIEHTGNELRVENFFELGFNQPATATRTLVRL